MIVLVWRLSHLKIVDRMRYERHASIHEKRRPAAKCEIQALSSKVNQGPSMKECVLKSQSGAKPQDLRKY